MTNNTELPEDNRAGLLKMCNTLTEQVRHVRRAVAVLEMCDTQNLVEAADRSGLCPKTVSMWYGRYEQNGLNGLYDLPRTGRPKIYTGQETLDLTALATAEPPYPHTKWTYRLLVEEMAERGYGVGEKWCRTTLDALEINPTKVDGWLGRPADPEAQKEFSERAKNVCDILLKPLQVKEIVVCLDEKTGIQALGRTSKDLLPRKGSYRKREFEYVRHGTVNLQGAYNHNTGEVLSMFCDSNNTIAFIKLVDTLIKTWAPDSRTVVHLILDNGASHTSKAARAYLEAHPQIIVYYTPVHASWLNPAELIFSKLQRQVLTYGSWESTTQLKENITAWYVLQNETPKRVNWVYQWVDPPPKTPPKVPLQAEGTYAGKH